MGDRSKAVKWLSVGLLFLSAQPAHTVDYEALARLLYSPYLALNYAVLCSVHDPSFQEKTAGPRGPMLAYMQHIRDEVLASLSSSEAQSVMVRAADAAKARAGADIRALAYGEMVDPVAVAAWCESHVKTVVRGVMETHDLRHTDFERLLAEARK